MKCNIIVEEIIAFTPTFITNKISFISNDFERRKNVIDYLLKKNIL